MRVQLVSDIHLEMRDQDLTDEDFEELVKPSGDILILAGDIGYFYDKNFKNFFNYVYINWLKVFYVLGNHEFYAGLTREETVRQTKEVLKDFYTVYVLDKEVHELDQNTVVLGCTLWSVLDEQFRYKITNSLSDFRKIRLSENKLLDFSTYKQWHAEDKLWLQNTIEQYRDLGKNIVVITHHLPFSEMASTMYPELNSAFVSDCDILVYSADYWFCGHSHITSSNLDAGVYLNCLGYPGEKTDHIKEYVIDVV